MSLKPVMGSSSKGFSYNVLPRLDQNPIEKSRYQMYGDPRPDGTYQIQKTLWDGTNIRVSQRVGSEERLWLRDKLMRLHVMGYLNEAEYQARDSVAEKAVTREDLNGLLRDLPDHEDEWKGVRKIPLGMDPAVSKEHVRRGVVVPVKTKRHPGNIFLLFIVLGIFSFLGGAIGVDSHATTALTVCAALLMGMGAVSVWAGSILARMT